MSWFEGCCCGSWIWRDIHWTSLATECFHTTRALAIHNGNERSCRIRLLGICHFMPLDEDKVNFRIWVFWKYIVIFVNNTKLTVIYLLGVICDTLQRKRRGLQRRAAQRGAGSSVNAAWGGDPPVLIEIKQVCVRPRQLGCPYSTTRICCCTPCCGPMLLRRRPCSNWSISPTCLVHSSKPAARCYSGRMGQTDWQTPYRYIDPVRHTMPAVPII